jgi:hypothetical protein
VETSNERFRDERLSASWFVNLADAKREIESWRLEHNFFLQHPFANWGHRTLLSVIETTAPYASKHARGCAAAPAG